MAEHLASIFGTEKDRVNCPFYFKIGACRHGDRCSRLHNKPTLSQTLHFANMYQHPENMADPGQAQEHFEDFYEDIFEELSKYGELESLNVCDNLADHMVGSVYAKFYEEEAAGAALQALSGRFYAGRPILVEFSPVTDFREATCRQYEENTCNRGGYCNFMHLKPVSRDMRKRLFGRSKRRERSYSPDQRRYERERDDRRGRGGYRDRDRYDDRRYDDRRDRDRDRYDDRRYDDRDRDRDRGRGRGRDETDEERRARIADWNRERTGDRGREETDDERRARIAAWNKEKEGPSTAEPEPSNGADRPADVAPPPADA
mmetsp:Transcript_6552/g.24331  ORF Transcript_6552/g.24331 Transcript_6552/m.24331 type:complete len:317 (-) Transcript_6552:125-1075(-)